MNLGDARTLRYYVNLEMLTRDGVTLRANLIRPDDDIQYPIVMLRLPYGKDEFCENEKDELNPWKIADRGYNVVIQDCRGFGLSEGEPTIDGENDIKDGYDAVEWAGTQSWGNGKVGMYGLSFFGFVQISAASQRPPHLVTACPFMCSSQYPITVNTGGSFVLGHIQWLYGEAQKQLRNMKISEVERERIFEEIEKNRPTLNEQFLKYIPMTTMPSINIEGFPHIHEFMEAVNGMDDLSYWKRSGIPFDMHSITIPMLHMTGWNDGVRDRTIQNYTLICQAGGSELARNNQRLVVGPWTHGSAMLQKVGTINYGSGSSGKDFGVLEMIISWFDYWLKGKDTGYKNTPNVQYFTLGENKWHSASAWPVPEAEMRDFYLGSDGNARSNKGDGQLALTQTGKAVEDTYLHNPHNPVPATPEGEFPTNGNMSSIQSREDVLVYSTVPLQKSVNVTGLVKVTVFAAFDAEDGDLWCRLTDVDEKGNARMLLQGMVRAKYRESMLKAVPVPAGKIEKYEIELGNISNLFLKGHQIRIDIAGSCFPAGDINSGTLAHTGYATEMKKAVHHIFHNAEYPSALHLPILHNA